jgi:hypothetical protein
LNRLGRCDPPDLRHQGVSPGGGPPNHQNHGPQSSRALFQESEGPVTGLSLQHQHHSPPLAVRFVVAPQSGGPDSQQTRTL